jgi:hypothetical protein
VLSQFQKRCAQDAGKGCCLNQDLAIIF